MASRVEVLDDDGARESPAVPDRCVVYPYVPTSATPDDCEPELLMYLPSLTSFLGLAFRIKIFTVISIVSMVATFAFSRAAGFRSDLLSSSVFILAGVFVNYWVPMYWGRSV